MKAATVRLVAWLVVFLSAASAGSIANARERRDPMAARTSRSAEQAARDQSAVRRAIEESARSFTDFTRTRSIDSVLSYYAKDFTGIENGLEAGLAAQRELLEDLLEQMAGGANVGLSLQTSKIDIKVTGSIAWATYDYLFRIGFPDGTWDEEEGKCSSVLEKSGAAWLFKHEHCSSVCPGEGEGEDEGEDPLQDRT